jgi:hypothetical protein
MEIAHGLLVHGSGQEADPVANEHYGAWFVWLRQIASQFPF